MDKMHAVAVAVCVAVCLAVSSVAIAATIPSGEVTYWDHHYLAGQPVGTGSDAFGWNFQARVFNGFRCNAFCPWW